jgi:hypothetical protein
MCVLPAETQWPVLLGIWYAGQPNQFQRQEAACRASVPGSPGQSHYPSR